METLKLELGGGYNPRSGYIVLDRIQGDYIIDFETDNIPFGDETVDEIFTQHMLEHIWNLTRLLNECHRVLKKGGIMEIIVPHKDNPRAYVLSHCRYFTEETFLTLERKEFEEYYGIKTWKVIEVVKNERPDIYAKLQKV